MGYNPRKLSADALFSVYNSDSYLGEIISGFRKKYDVSSQDMRFINELTNGVMKYKIRIDYIISKCSDIRLKKISLYVLCVLECAVYQILFMDRVPDEAAVDEAVRIVKTSRFNKASGYVNAVLRRVSENKGDVQYPSDETENFSVYCSLPLWIAKRWASRYGLTNAKALAKAMLTRPELTLRCNLLKTDPALLCKSLNEKGIDVSVYENEKSDIGYILTCSNMHGLDKLDEFINGHFYVQDFAAALTVEILAPKSGETVVDMCAAPGGKTTHIAEKMNNKGRILAFDIHEHKIKRIKENALRLGVDIIEASVADGTEFNCSLAGIADRVLADVPCSGLGVLRKKPDIKHFRKEEDILSLASISRQILENAAGYLRCGGVLVYSTCTIEPEENENVINEFLKVHPEFCLDSIQEYKSDNPGYFTLYPHKDGSDGFFICRMKKTM